MMQIAHDRGWKAISGVEAMIEQGLAVSRLGDLAHGFC